MHKRSVRINVAIAAAWLILASIPVLAQLRSELPLTSSDGIRRVLFELRLAETQAVRGLTFEATLKPSGQTIHLHYVVVATNEDILRAEVAERSGQYSVGVVLSSEGTTKLIAATARHNGRPVAAVLDGEVVASVTVQNPRPLDIVFGGAFTREEATRIAAALTR